MSRPNRTDHIRLTSHPAPGAKPRFPIAWGAATARERGPIIGTVSRPADRNVIGTHGGSYAVYRALAVSSGALDPDPAGRPHQHAARRRHRPVPAVGRRHQTIVSLDPWGHMVAEAFAPRDRPGHRHPPQHRRDARAARPGGDRSRRWRRAGSPTTARWCSRAAACPWSRSPSIRSGICPASPSASAPPTRACAAPCSSRPPACSPSW